MSLTAKVTGYWGLNGNANDTVGSNHGSATNVSYPIPGFLGTRYAQFSNGFINLSSPIIGTGSWSVFLWVRLTGGGIANLIGFGSENISQNLMLSADPAGQVTMEFWGGTQAISGATISDGEWHLVGVVYDSVLGSASLYIDNNLDTSIDVILDIGPDYFFMGKTFGGSSNLTGDIDDVSFFSDVLDATELSDLWNGGAGDAHPWGNAPLSAEVGTFTLIGRAASTNKGFRLTAAQASFTLTGNAATLIEKYPDLKPITAFFNIEHGWPVELRRGNTNLLRADRSGISVQGFDATISKSFGVEKGTFNLSFPEANIETGGHADLVADPVLFQLNEPPSMAELRLGFTHLLRADRSGVSVQGFDAVISKWLIPPGTASFSFTGNPVSVYKGYYLQAAQRSFTLTGNAATTLFHRRCISDTQIYLYGGTNTALRYARIMAATTRSYSLTGYAVNMGITKLMVASTGSFALTPKDCQLVYASTLGPGLILANLEAALAKLMDQNNPNWPGFPAGNAIVAFNFATAVHAYAKYVRPQSSGAALGLPAFISAMMPLLSAPGPMPFFPAIQAGMTAYATALGVGMAASGNVAVPPVLPADWTGFLALPKDGPLQDKITDLATVIHEWFLEGTATPLTGGSTVNWS